MSNTDCIKHCNKCVPYGDNDAIQQAFQQDGYVVVTNVLTDKEVSTMLEELWTSPRLLGRPGIDKNNPETWTAKNNWPQQSNGGKNFLGSSDVFQDAASWDLTSNERVVSLQRLLYQRDDIMCASLGRWGVMRPTAGGHPEWKTDSSWLHWDQNPWTEPHFTRLQAIVCFTDNTATSGGFACVPRFHKRFEQWGKDHPMGTLVTPTSGRTLDETYGVNQPFPVPLDDPCQRDVVRILAPAGSMILWDSRLPHQNFPNTDKTAFRIIHYTMMIVKNEKSVRDYKKLLEQNRVVMEVLGIQGQRFPHGLSATGRRVNCLDNDEKNSSSIIMEVTEGLKQAIPLVLEAGKAEERGDIPSAIKYYQKALRLYPDIEDWYGAIMR